MKPRNTRNTRNGRNHSDRLKAGHQTGMRFGVAGLALQVPEFSEEERETRVAPRSKAGGVVGFLG